MKSRRFVDSITAYVYAGSGGNGCVSWRREKGVPRGGPDGGDGGRGGHVILKADRNVDSLVDFFFVPHRHADDGAHGSGQKIRGKCGKDLVIGVPCGTEVWNAATGEMLADLVNSGDEYLAANGGKGGNGNFHWRTKGHVALTAHTDGEPGEETVLRLELKLVADVGLVGFPNAGKSSVLTAISDAHPKIAAYPFTTLNPIIGTIMYADYAHITMADLPGLIEGAHDGVGLGHAFLRHIERAPCLIYLIDMAGADGREPWDDYRQLREEIGLHKAELLERPSIVVANKMDLEEAVAKYPKFVKRTGTKPVKVSAVSGEGIDKLKAVLRKLRDRMNRKPGTRASKQTRSPKPASA